MENTDIHCESIKHRVKWMIKQELKQELCATSLRM